MGQVQACLYVEIDKRGASEGQPLAGHAPQRIQANQMFDLIVLSVAERLLDPAV